MVVVVDVLAVEARIPSNLLKKIEENITLQSFDSVVFFFIFCFLCENELKMEMKMNDLYQVVEMMDIRDWLLIVY